MDACVGFQTDPSTTLGMTRNKVNPPTQHDTSIRHSELVEQRDVASSSADAGSIILGPASRWSFRVSRGIGGDGPGIPNADALYLKAELKRESYSAAFFAASRFLNIGVLASSLVLAALYISSDRSPQVKLGLWVAAQAVNSKNKGINSVMVGFMAWLQQRKGEGHFFAHIAGSGNEVSVEEDHPVSLSTLQRVGKPEVTLRETLIKSTFQSGE